MHDKHAALSDAIKKLDDAIKRGDDDEIQSAHEAVKQAHEDLRHEDDDDDNARRKDSKRRRHDDDDEEDREFGEPTKVRYDVAADNKRRTLMAELQCRADKVANAFGEEAPRPMSGERPEDYRRAAQAPSWRRAFAGFAPAGRTFISYSRKDGAKFAAELRNSLEKENLSVWQDRSEQAALAPLWPQIQSQLIFAGEVHAGLPRLRMSENDATRNQPDVGSQRTEERWHQTLKNRPELESRAIFRQKQERTQEDLAGIICSNA
jgi:hypothetical protein